MNYAELEKAYASLLIDPDFTGLELLLQKPNIFSALKIIHYENRHSNFLGWLLDPNQTHGLGSKLLKWILSDIFQDDRVNTISVADIATLPFEQTKVYREWNNIDLLILIKDIVVVFENKIGTGEHSDQLNRYKKLIDAQFGEKRKVFVYLSPSGRSSSMNEVYVNYSYSKIVILLERLVTVYKSAVLPSVLLYIEDYIETIKTHFMSISHTNILARKIYNNHKGLFDFILNHTPNTLKELSDYFNLKINENGWRKVTSERHYIRFLTPALDKIIPRNGTSWKGEAFLFEFNIADDSFTFYFTIGPGDENTRTVLKSAVDEIEGIEGWEESGGYFCYAELTVETELIKLQLVDTKFMDAHLKDFWAHVYRAVTDAENAILGKGNQLTS